MDRFSWQRTGAHHKDFTVDEQYLREKCLLCVYKNLWGQLMNNTKQVSHLCSLGIRSQCVSDHKSVDQSEHRWLTGGGASERAAKTDLNLRTAAVCLFLMTSLTWNLKNEIQNNSSSGESWFVVRPKKIKTRADFLWCHPFVWPSFIHVRRSAAVSGVNYSTVPAWIIQHRRSPRGGASV